MQKVLFLTLLVHALPAFSQIPNGLIVRQSNLPVREAETRAVAQIEQAGLSVFSRIDHAQNARDSGMELGATRLILFGSPRVGTVLMRCGRSVGIDLPLKLLIWSDESGRTRIAYNDPQYLAARHRLEPQCHDILERVGTTVAGIVAAAISD